MVEVLFIGVLFVVFAGWFWMLISAQKMLNRNEEVADYRRSLLSRISHASMTQMKRGNYDWQWRYDEFEAVSYNDMMKQRNKPLDSFYPRDPARMER